MVADSAADTLTLAAGSNITLTTNAGTDTVTIAASASATAAGGAGDVQYNNGSNALTASSNFDYGTDNTNALTLNTSNTTNGIDYNLVLDHENTSSPGTSTGVGIKYLLRDSTTANQNAAATIGIWSNATHGSSLESNYRIDAVHQGSFQTVALFGGVGSLHIGGNVSTVPSTAGVINMDAGFQINGVATAGLFAQAGGSIYAASAYKLPTTVSSDQTVLTSNGTDYVGSPPQGSRGNTTTSATSWTPDFNTYSLEGQTALAGAITINAPTFTGSAAKNGTMRTLRLKDNGTGRAITWTTGSSGAFRASTDLALPTTTIASKTLYMRFYWNNDDSRWDLMSVLNNF